MPMVAETDLSRAARFYGEISSADSTGVTGWALNGDKAATPILLEILIDGEVVGETGTGKECSDLSKTLKRPVDCAFYFTWDEARFPDRVMRADGDVLFTIAVRAKKSAFLVTGSEDATRVKRSLLPAQSRESDARSLSRLTRKEYVALLSNFPGQVDLPRSAPDDVKLIAYYLPQFHPTPENDEWWGPGFTEWTNVTRAEPYFDGHYQPHLPSSLGFYDLRLPEVRGAQAKLAREYGIYGFCYYYYWFAGRRILERPLQEVFESGKPDFPFCICWANESWSRRWDGSEDDVLIRQIHNEENDIKFIHDVIPLLKDPRYIRIDGAPLLIVYRINLMPNPTRTVDLWREICADAGIGQVHLCMAETFKTSEPRHYGFDSAVEFPPHDVRSRRIEDEVKGLAEGFTGRIHDYEEVVKNELVKQNPGYKRFRGVMVSWDNTPRKREGGNAFVGSTPELYEAWLRGAIDFTRENFAPGERLVFINAWNEWAEGAHLEPDQKHGHAYLEASRRAIADVSDWRTLLKQAHALDSMAGETKRRFLLAFETWLMRYELSTRYLGDVLSGLDSGVARPQFRKRIPPALRNCEVVDYGAGCLERVNHRGAASQPIEVDRRETLYLHGWAWCEGVTLSESTQAYLRLRAADGKAEYFAALTRRLERQDVVQANDEILPDCTRYSGFSVITDIRDVDPGLYAIEIIHFLDDRAAGVTFDTELSIV